MLQQLSVKNLALIDHLDLSLEEGLVAFTGETGAGKSVIFNAIGLLLGERASAESIRHGCDEGVVVGVFAPEGEVLARVMARLEAAGFEASDTLIVRRSLQRNGRHRAWLNDAPVTVSLLAEVVGEMMEVVGQHQHLLLMREAEQLRMIDRWARPGALATRMAEDHATWRAAVAERKALEAARADRAERLEFLRFQRDEIAALELRDGEYDALEASLHRARHAEKLRAGHGRAQRALYSANGSAVERIGEAQAELQRLLPVDPALAELLARLEEAEAMVADVSYELEGRLDDDDSSMDLDALESRHQKIRNAIRRFGADEAGLLARLDELAEEIDRLENLGERMDEIEAVEAAAYARASESADALDAHRRATAEVFFAKVAEELARLEMGGVRLTLLDAPERGTAPLTAHGWDSIRILFSANPGEAPKPLGRVASGGELSRLLLAIKRVMMERDPIPTCLFDEVDTGIGGQAAVAVGEMLREVAVGRQILCITHLAQIASRAHYQHLVEKRVDEGRTVSSIRALDEAQRERELARMLGGSVTNDVSLAHARSMLAS